MGEWLRPDGALLNSAWMVRVYTQIMPGDLLVVDYVIVEDSQNFPARHLLPEGMQKFAKFGPTQVWRWREEIPNETIDSSPYAVIESALQRLKLSHMEFSEYLGVMQHWWPTLHSQMSESLKDRVDAHTGDSDVSVHWDYLLVRKSNPTQLEDLLKISAQMVARCYGLTEAIRHCQAIMSDIPGPNDLTKLREAAGDLEEVRHALLVNLVTSDARPVVYGSFEFGTYSKIRRVWNMEEIETSSKRSLDACESLLADIRQASQAKRERWRAETLLALTIVSSVSAIFSFFTYIDDSVGESDFIKIGVPVVVALGAAIIFGVLRRSSSN